MTVGAGDRPGVRGAVDAAAPGTVLLVNTADQGGGAERVAGTLLEGFERRGADAWLAVGDKRSGDPRVVPLFQSPRVDYRPHARWSARARQATLRWLDRRLGLEDYRHPFSWHLLELTRPPPDVVCAINLHGGFFDLRCLAPLSRRVPVALSLVDCWTMTGHCAYPIDCPRWARGCGACPDLTLPPALPRDATRINWHRKRAIYRRARLWVATPSAWLQARLHRSMLAPAVEADRVIPLGVDLSVFRPAPPAVRREARRALGIPDDDFTLLFVANLGRDNPYKDYPTMRAALAALAGEPARPPLRFVVVGKAGPTERVGRLVVEHAPYTAVRPELARRYQTADLYLHAARDEAFGLVIAEAMASGLPVVATARGGIPELVADGRHGLLVAPGDVAGMARSIRLVSTDPALRERLGREAAARAERELDQELMVDRYVGWLGALVEARRRERQPPGP